MNTIETKFKQTPFDFEIKCSFWFTISWPFSNDDRQFFSVTLNIVFTANLHASLLSLFTSEMASSRKKFNSSMAERIHELRQCSQNILKWNITNNNNYMQDSIRYFESIHSMDNTHGNHGRKFSSGKVGSLYRLANSEDHTESPIQNANLLIQGTLIKPIRKQRRYVWSYLESMRIHEHEKKSALNTSLNNCFVEDSFMATRGKIE